MIQDVGCRIQWDLIECVVVIVIMIMIMIMMVSVVTSLEMVVGELEVEFFFLELPCCVHFFF